MADSQYVAGKRRYGRGRQTAASENHDWEPRRGESRHSLPYRIRQPEIQRPDRRNPKYSSRPSRTSEDLAHTGAMPAPMRMLPRPATPKSRGRRQYDEDEDDDDDDSERERLRGRLRSRSRAPSGPASRPASKSAWGGKSRATSGVASRAPSGVTSRAKSGAKSRPVSRDSQSTDSSPFPTPTRSSFVQLHPAPSAPSPGASTESSSEDSDDESSGSTQDYRMHTRTLKERMNMTPDSEPAPNPAARSRSRHKSRERIVPEIESPTEDSDDQARRPRLILKKRSLSRPRLAHQSRSPSRAPRHRRQTDRHGEERPSLSPKRGSKKYHHSDFAQPRETPFSRSRATSASRVKSAQSAGSSSKPSLGNFFPTSGPSQPYDQGSKSHTCVACKDRLPAEDLAKLKCGHRWCEDCLKRRFELSIEDVQNMPPRCCTSDIIPIKYVTDLFGDDFKKTWNEKFAKFSARGRIYCPRPKCREPIRPTDYRHHSNGRTSATCRKCEAKICGLCYNKWHESKRCPGDADTAQFLKVAKEAGWKRCFNCQAMVELKEGCNHMTCRCGAQFCMICGLKWKGCECPWFSYDLEEEDEFGHVQIPIPMVSRERLGGAGGVPRGLRPDLGYAPEPRHHRGHRDDDRTRRLQHVEIDVDDDEEDDDHDDYIDGMGGVVGAGDTGGHFMGDSYRRRSHSTAVPQAPSAPLAAPSVAHERTKSGTNYVSGVNKARGVRGSSMERRLADRFEQRQSFNPHHRSFGQPGPPLTAPPLTAPPLGMAPLPHQPPMVPSPISRRHTIDNDMYDIPFDPRYASHAIPRRSTSHAYVDDFAVHAPLGRRRYRQMEPPRPSELAGLTGPGGGMNRVFEWANHVETFPPDNQTVA